MKMKMKKINYADDFFAFKPMFNFRCDLWIPSRDTVKYIPSKFLPSPKCFLDPVYFAMGMVKGDRGISCSFSGVN